MQLAIVARIFYAILFGVTAALGSIVWTRHGLPNLWAHLFAVRSAQAQTAGGPHGPRTGVDSVLVETVPLKSATQRNGSGGKPIRTRGYLARRPALPLPDDERGRDGPPAGVTGRGAAPDEDQRADEDSRAVEDAAVGRERRMPSEGPEPRAVRRPAVVHHVPASSGPDYARQKIDLEGAPGPVSPDEAGQPGEAPRIPFENTKIMAKVGSELILAGDVLPSAMENLNERLKHIPKGQTVSPEAFQQALDQAIVQQVEMFVKIKLLYLQAKKKIPEDKLPEIQKKIAADLDEHMVAALMENMKCKTRQELDEKLRASLNSLERIKRITVEETIAKQWLKDHANGDDEKVTHEDMLACYRENLAKYEHPATARYEELFVKLSKYRSEAAARAALEEIGNLVYHGAPWADVAKARSDGSTAAEGGLREEIREGSHVSRVVDAAIFSLALGAMSPILADLDPKLKDRRGFYIIRVIERKPAWRDPFTEVQADLAEQIKKQRTAKKQEEYLKKVAAETKVWRVYEAKNTAKPPTEPDRYLR
ncbi:MAG TPA: peptidyl-prolyl cis-trans isomerase [Pirellulales bacterium]|jgi:peptidyl-prolyl cis-trans isomerase C|nr:peptidyl-prolyl cis-trans isomerase [Pirellulales bacterium]